MKDSILFKKSDEFAYLVYQLTKGFPKDELYGLTSQLRRSALSIPLNITEGFARGSKNEYRRFLDIAYGSLKEAKYLLYFALREKYITKQEYEKVIELAEEIGRLIWAQRMKLQKDSLVTR